MAADGGADGGSSRSGEAREGDSAGVAAEEDMGVLAFLLPKKEREEDWGVSGGMSAVGLVAVGEPWGEGDLRLPKEVERKRELDERLDTTGACMSRRKWGEGRGMSNWTG